MNIRFSATTAALLLSITPALAQDSILSGYAIKETPGKHVDVILDGKPVTRMMTEFKDDFDTGKVFHHVFDAEGKNTITKGAGGKFPHHRGIFLGWAKTKFDGASHDTWHLKGKSRIKFEKILSSKADAKSATFKAAILWTSKDGKPMIDEERTVTVSKTKDSLAIIEIDTTLKASYGDVELNGDPEHAGCQYRPHNDVNDLAGQIKKGKAPKEKATKYLMPKDGADLKKETDFAWAASAYSLGEKRYNVLFVPHSSIPEGNKFSAYRDYGRFGAYFVKKIAKGESLRLRYKFVIAEGELGKREAYAAIAKAFRSEK